MARPPREAVPTVVKAIRTPRRDFARLVNSTPPTNGKLPLTHMTDAYTLRDISAVNRLTPTDCAIFQEPLLYLFYGRPAYRVASQQRNSGLDAYWPVCFVLKSDNVVPSRVYPFDTGAFEDGRFDDYRHHGMIKEDFELEPDPSSPGRLINLFWPDARSYFDNRASLVPDTDPFDFEAKYYRELIGTRANRPFDERHSAIEIQSRSPIRLADNLVAIIVPQDFATDGLITKFEAMDVIVLPIPTVGRTHADSMVSQIYDVCRDLYGGKHSTRSGKQVRFW